MRERSTWNRQEVMSKAAALKKVADPYTMNQDHPQPSAEKYVTGDPSTFAEDVHSPNSWEDEYSGDEVDRNEIGMPEFRSDTWNHAEKTANEEALIKKANLCIAVSKLILDGSKTASEEVIEDQALALMNLSDGDLLATAQRLAADDSDEDEDDSEEDDGQEKQAADDDSAEEDDSEEDEGQEKQAADEEDDSAEEDDSDEGQEKQASVDQIAQAIQASLSDQIQQMVQQAMQQVMPGMQQQQMQQDPMEDEQALDQMLAGQGCDPMAEADIQMDPAPMDDMDYMASDEDQILTSLFASDESGEEEEEEQEKQARTASTRTVGTRPTTGVAKLGGTSKVASENGVDQLSSLWNSAPDVRDYFGTK